MEYEGAVDFWSKPKIFFLLLTAIYNVQCRCEGYKGILYINSKLTTYERFEIKQRSNDFKRECGSNWEAP